MFIFSNQYSYRALWHFSGVATREFLEEKPVRIGLMERSQISPKRGKVKNDENVESY